MPFTVLSPQKYTLPHVFRTRDLRWKRIQGAEHVCKLLLNTCCELEFCFSGRQQRKFYFYGDERCFTFLKTYLVFRELLNLQRQHVAGTSFPAPSAIIIIMMENIFLFPCLLRRTDTDSTSLEQNSLMKIPLFEYPPFRMWTRQRYQVPAKYDEKLAQTAPWIRKQTRLVPRVYLFGESYTVKH